MRQLVAAGAGALVPRTVLRGQGGAPILIGGQPVEIAIASISAVTVRITVREATAESALPNAGALVDAAVGRTVGRQRSAFGPVRAGDLVVRAIADPLTIEVATRDGKPVQSFSVGGGAPNPSGAPSHETLSFSMGGSLLLGLGEGGPQFDRKGTTYTNRNGQGGYQLRTHGGRVPIQWLVGTDGWGVFIHRPLGSLDLTGSRGTLSPNGTLLPIDVFVTASSDPKVIIGEYARLTGFAELPPRWGFGYMQSHRTLAGPEEIDWVARTFREKQLPCDALIYLGTEFTPSGWNTRNGEFGWNPHNFPNPRKFVDDMHARHFKVVLHVVIEGRRMSGIVADACTPEMAVPSGRTPDDKWPDDRAVPCYWPYHKPLYELGVDGMWPDQGDGLDESSRLARIRMYSEGPQRYRPNERPFALHRNGAPGMQRYGAFLWSGDVYSTWETLKTHVPVAINTGLSGIPFWGTDIGGFVPTAEYTGELHVRWFQFGTFCPSFRSHGRDWHLRLPWGWNTGEIGPKELRGYTDGAADPDPSELRNAAVEPIVRKYLELRYRMLPYTYTIARECVDTGLPMMRALWLHHPDDPRAVARGDQYLWGRDVLVAPVVEKGATNRAVYLPKGTWFDFWTEQALEGGREIDRAVDLATLPLFVRAGAIIPMGPIRQYVDELVEGPLTVTVYPGANATFVLYEDDGTTFEYKRGDWMRVAMTWTNASRTFRIQLASGSRVRPSAVRSVDVRIAGTRTMRRIEFGGQPIEVRL